MINFTLILRSVERHLQSIITSNPIRRLFFICLLIWVSISTLGQKKVTPYSRIYSKYAEYQNIAGIQPYLFIVNGEQYILSYDTLKNKEMRDQRGYNNPEFFKEVAHRPAYIFRNTGSGWIKATITPVQYDSYTYDSIGYSYFNNGTIKPEWQYSTDCYWTAIGKPSDVSGHRVIQLNEGKIAMLITNYHSYEKAIENGQNFKAQPYNFYTIRMVVLVPIGGKIYTPVVFNPINAGKIPYDYQAMLAQMNNVEVNKNSFELTTNGEIIKFEKEDSQITQESGTFKDTRDGKVYKIVQIGTQTWFAENLAYKAVSGCWAYNNDENNVKTYGYLYNWKTARLACPTGWRLPSFNDWRTLIEFVGHQQYPQEIAGSKLKEAGHKHWDEPQPSQAKDAVSTNEFGFTALPSGIYFSEKNFDGIGWRGAWWVNTNYNTSQFAYSYSLSYANKRISEDYNIVKNGLSVRCIKEQ